MGDNVENWEGDDDSESQCNCCKWLIIGIQNSNWISIISKRLWREEDKKNILVMMVQMAVKSALPTKRTKPVMVSMMTALKKLRETKSKHSLAALQKLYPCMAIMVVVIITVKENNKWLQGTYQRECKRTCWCTERCPGCNPRCTGGRWWGKPRICSLCWISWSSPTGSSKTELWPTQEIQKPTINGLL